ncbi:DUF4276 family protein [Corallococcus sp. bb12-1]|uniref:DUF4276 family protein n=1 Tax=Corallococcus sp. bb12-1 TaxID=2996784 RepID=UPI002270A511|nr:DUF4276 family protein [Corallococcus sp. bb12-1]MCY1047649.1 DUF4276 family protein [Corallococcus sp. bb12-1]
MKIFLYQQKLSLMFMDKLLLFVEGPTDVKIVNWLLDAADYPHKQLHIIPMGGKKNIASLIKSTSTKQRIRYAVLIDLDETGVADAAERARQQMGHPAVDVFCAVPEIEAWLFADKTTALTHARSDEARLILSHVPLPEAIPHPRKLARSLFGPPDAWDFMRQINIEHAAAMSPSMRTFLVGMGKLLQIEKPSIINSVGRSINRDVLSGLISEIVPSDTVVWHTSTGAYTATELRHHIESGTEIGMRYAIDLLRVSRDFLMRKAIRKTDT